MNCTMTGIQTQVLTVLMTPVSAVPPSNPAFLFNRLQGNISDMVFYLSH